ncbi:SAM-dependent methyltransferase [Streptomyces beijiangensis]|uniref:Methyltransferase domain-containing protein n=1 Tax=Streptomyces beijiangensis TaxID=163361 RepID=A0A939JH52_9ACTN|nr:methyltransferase domain-containing protein [Streptomyces beijiangensis]MBO0515881.1 methyltransferase domain-containing protein [Streptomyces beijiangensis]
MTYAEADLIATIEQLAGAELSTLPQAQLDAIDQYHAGGTDAVDCLIPHLALTAGMTALDVGSGLGGPARQIARSTGCNVVGVDVTPAYVDAARVLTDVAGLTDRIELFCSDIATFEPTGFDAAYCIHVQMNIADKKAFFAGIARRLRPEARLVIFEVCKRDGSTEPELLLPWSLDGTDSHLVTADELRDTILSSGFASLEWVDESDWARQWFEDFGRRLAGANTPAALPALLVEGPTRMLNFAVAVATGAVTIHRGVFVRAPSG